TPRGNDRAPRPTYRERGPVAVSDLRGVPLFVAHRSRGPRPRNRPRGPVAMRDLGNVPSFAHLTRVPRVESRSSTVRSGDMRWITPPEHLLIVVVRATGAHFADHGASPPIF